MENAGMPRSEKTEVNVHSSIDIGRVATSLKDKFKTLSDISDECCIYKVPERLRKINAEAYTPVRVSIGPIHHGAKQLKPMEEHKLRYLQDFVERNASHNTLEEYLEFIKEKEKRIRECYSETFTEISSEAFLEIILVDAAFIIEVLLRHWNPYLIPRNDRIFRKPRQINDIVLDMLLLENQIPYFVLNDLYGKAMQHQCYGPSPPSFYDLAINFFKNLSIIKHQPEKIDTRKVEHLIDFLRSCYRPNGSQLLIDFLRSCHRQNGIERKLASIRSAIEHLIDFLIRSCHIPIRRRQTTQQNGIEGTFLSIRSATALHEAGVKFVVSYGKNLLDIKFIDGVLEIPYTEVTDSTECCLRNLLAFEQCHYGNGYMVDYAVFMDSLINTSRDVELLVQKGIIGSWLGENEEVSMLFNKLCKEIYTDQNDFHFSQLSEKLNDYCKMRRNKWKANLRHDYFSSPWRVLSIVAAFVLLVLTLIQTVCSVMSARAGK